MVSAGALRVQPAVHQQPPRSMAEKPQIQLFIKVRGVLRSVRALAANPGSAAVGWLGWEWTGGPTAMPRCGALGRQEGKIVSRASGTR